MSAYRICPDCGHIKWVQDQCIAEIPTHCDSYMQIVDEHIVPILHTLRKKKYQTAFSCQGHFSYIKEFGGEILEMPYICFKATPISVIERFETLELGIYPMDVLFKAANENMCEIVKLNRWLDLKYEWEMENTINIFYEEDRPVFKTDNFHVRLRSELSRKLFPDIELDLTKIRNSIYNSVTYTLERRPWHYDYEADYLDRVDNGAHMVSITPRIWQKKVKKLGLDMSHAEDFLKFCKANAPSTIKRVSKKEVKDE